MNILYIGPYRQTDYIGQVSNTHIESIKKTIKSQDNIVTRPIYLNPSLSVKTGILNTENIPTSMTNIDVTIQYLPIDYAAINCFSKNIYIPILDPKLNSIACSNYDYKILSCFNKILVNDDKQKFTLKAIDNNLDIEIYEESIQSEEAARFDFGVMQTFYKFGFIGQCSYNKQIIQKLITSFLIASRSLNNVHLYMFLLGTDSDKLELEEFIKTTKKTAQIASYIDNISCIFGLWNGKEATAALNSIDCYISLNDDNRQYLYEKYFMSSQNSKFLISRNNTEAIEVPVTHLTSSNEYDNTLYSISTQSLIKNIQRAVTTDKQKHKKTQLPTLGTIVCRTA